MYAMTIFVSYLFILRPLGFTTFFFLFFFIRTASVLFEVVLMENFQHISEGSKYKNNCRKNGNYNKLFGCHGAE